MDILVMAKFFTWCTIINGSLLLLWGFCFMFMPNLVYRTQSAWFPIPREQFTVIMYCFLGLFKIFYLFFNVVPLIVLIIMR